ncbi:MAG: ComEC family competence protein, partial [Flavobacterium sp.]|nr:ComEC family competence protein [Flavobacterium sp.]
ARKFDFQDNLFSYSAFIVAFLIGITTQVCHTNLYQKNHYFNQIGSTETGHLMEISLKEKLKNSAFNDRFVANVLKFDNKNSTGRIIVNFRKDSLYNNNLIIGNRLKINASIYKNKSIKNPNQFDYGKYLENQNIYAQVYCNFSDVKISPIIDKNIWYFTAKFRNQIIHNLQKNGFSKNELAVVVALILGQQQDISPEILQDYQLAGAVHILSVSGLHVGFILLFVGYLLKPFPNNKNWKTYKLLIVILSLWLFGFVAGLAPSVLRSVVMFSFVALGRYLGRGVNIYNTLLVSAFIILLFQPSFLFDVGFQLSYVSLFFIIWLQPLFASIWQPKSKIILFFWEIITVSFAAQIGAMGLSIYYFHQFPGLFFLTNLVILPAMGFILGYGVIVMLLAYFDVIPIFATKILEYSIWVLNQVIAWIASLEQFILRDISMNKTMLIGFYFMIFGVFMYFKKPNFNRLVAALITVVFFQISIFSSKYIYQSQSELVVFNINKNTIIAERFGKKTIIFANNSLLKIAKKNSNIKQYLVGNFSNIKSKKQIQNLMFFGNKKILVMDSVAFLPKNLNPDVLIITNSPKLNLERFLTFCKPKTIVADASNFKTYINAWKNTCDKRNIYFHDTNEKGFFRLE